MKCSLIHCWFFLLWRLTSEYSRYRPTAPQLLMLCRLQFQMWHFFVVIVYLLYVFFFLWIPVNQWLFSTRVLAFYNYNVSVLWCCRYWNINTLTVFPRGLLAGSIWAVWFVAAPGCCAGVRLLIVTAKSIILSHTANSYIVSSFLTLFFCVITSELFLLQ